MRIAYVTETHPPEINGVALTVGRTVTYLRRRGHAVDVIRPAQAGEAHGSTPGGWLSHGWPIPMYRDLRFGMSWPSVLQRRFAQAGAQLVHVATEGPLGFAAVVAANRLGLVATSDFRTNFHQYSHYYHLGWLEPMIRQYLRWFHNRTRMTFVPTRQTRQALLDAGFQRLEVVGRGVDLERFHPERRDPALRAAWGAGTRPVLLYVGRLAREKNIELALRAFREAGRRGHESCMVVVGDGPCRAALAQAYPEVRFAGMQTGTALAAHYASADLFVFPSESETFGNVTLEALASGLPVMAFDLAAAAEYVVDGRNGCLVAPGRHEDFVAATSKLLADTSVLRAMRPAARACAQGSDWEQVLGTFEARLLQAAHGSTAVRSVPHSA